MCVDARVQSFRVQTRGLGCADSEPCLRVQTRGLGRDVPTLNRACERGMRYTSRELLDNGGLVDHRP